MEVLQVRDVLQDRKDIRRADPNSLLAFIGNKPSIQISRMTEHLKGVQIFAKAEWLNPGGSVKDRAGLRIIEDGERSGELTRDKIILDSTSGNTGIAYAMDWGVQRLSGGTGRPCQCERGEKKSSGSLWCEPDLHGPFDGIGWSAS